MTYVLFLRNKNTLIFHTVSTSLHTSHSTIMQTGFFFLLNYFKHGFWIIFLLFIYFFLPLYWVKRHDLLKTFVNFTPNNFRICAGQKVSQKCFKNFLVKILFCLQGQINPLKLRINKGEKNWVFFFIPKMWQI